MGYATSGQVLAQAETSIGATVRVAVANYYNGLDLDTAQAIRQADNETEAAELVAAIRRGRVSDVLSVAVLASLGAVAGAVSQKAVNNASVRGIPLVAPLGMVPAAVGVAAPLSLSLRSVLTAGGVSYMVGAAIYQMAQGR